jgi:hypothetical protein
LASQTIFISYFFRQSLWADEQNVKLVSNSTIFFETFSKALYLILVGICCMDQSVFLLVKDSHNSCRDVIRHRDGDLRVHVYCLNDDDFEPNPDELQFYGNDNDKLLVFETSHYNGDDPLLVIEAIRWYADYIDNPRMEILAEDPRISDADSLYL